MTSRSVLVGMMVAMLGSVAALIGLGLHSAHQLRDDMADLDHVRDASAKVRGVSTALLDVMTSQRGYLLTSDSRYLDRYRHGTQRLDQQLDALSAAVALSPDESDAMQAFKTLTEKKRQELDRSIAVADAQGLAPAMTAIGNDKNHVPLDDIRASLERVDGLIAASQARRQADRSASVQRQERTLLALTASLAVLCAALFVMFRRQAALHARLLSAESALRDQLEQRMVERTAELRATAERLAVSESRLRGIFDCASDGILTTDDSQIIVEANPAAARMFRCSVADLIGSPLDRLIPAPHRAMHWQQVEAFGASGEGSRPMGGIDPGRVVTALRTDGEEFPIDASISCSEVSGRRLYTVIHRDITDQRRAVAALRSSEQLLAATFSASGIPMAQMDPATTRFVAVNDALCRLSGYTSSELLTMGPDDLNHPDDRLDAEKVGALLRDGAPYHEQKRIVRKDGAVVWVQVSGSVVRDADGRAVRLVGLLQDITGQREAERTLRASEARLGFLVRLNDRLRELQDPQTIAYEAACLLGEFVAAERVGYAEDGGDGQTITVARNYTRDVPGIEGRYRYDDYGPQLLSDLRAGHTVVRPDIPHDPTLSEDEKAAHATLQLGATVNVPLLRDAKLDAVFFVHSAAPRQWTAAEVSLFEDVALRIRADISRARAQAATSAARAKLEAALGSMSDSVMLSDPEGRFVEFNDAFVSFHRFGTRAECSSALARYADLFDVWAADGSPVPFEQWAVPRALRGEAASSVEYRLRRRDSGQSWVGSFSFAPIRAEDGRILGAVVTGRDVTELKNTQEQLARSHATLQHLFANLQGAQEDERKRIARELHDDLQQSLAAIRMDAVAAGERMAKGRRDIDPLLARIDRLSGAAIDSTRRIVNDLRPEMLEELGLVPALEAMCAEFAQTWSIDCRLEVSGAEMPKLRDSPVLSVGLYRMAQEALNNVAKHAKASTVRVQLECDHSGLVTLRVTDNGVGMPARETRNPASFGLLGMSERVRMLGGHLRIEAQAGRGTMIEALLPIAGASPTDASSQTAGPALALTATDRPSDASVRDVLGRPLQSVIDALDGNVAVLDSSGIIRFVNRAWTEFAARHGNPELKGCGPGVSYLDVCRRSTAAEPLSGSALQGLQAVLAGQAESFVAEYPCQSPEAEGWFRMHAGSIIGGWLIVSHVGIHRPDGREAPAGAGGGGNVD